MEHKTVKYFAIIDLLHSFMLQAFELLCLLFVCLFVGLFVCIQLTHFTGRNYILPL